jgi:hypothetical protein
MIDVIVRLTVSCYGCDRKPDISNLKGEKISLAHGSVHHGGESIVQHLISQWPEREYLC